MRFFCSAKVRAGARAMPGTVARQTPLRAALGSLDDSNLSVFQGGQERRTAKTGNIEEMTK